MTEGYLFNTGGPMSRTCTARLRASLLGKRQAQIRCPRRRRVGIQFPSGADPRSLVLALCQSCGYPEPEAAKGALRHLLPSEAMVAMPSQHTIKCIWSEMTAEGQEGMLVEALLLGLCTAHLYDPDRPVLWTGTSLTRKLELFAMEGFYAA